MSNSCLALNGYGYNCNHVTFMIVEIIKLFYMPINGRTFWKKLGTFLAERWHESRRNQA